MDQFDTSALKSHDRQVRYQIPSASDAPIICFSHLRWDFVFQRPQHLLSEALKNHRVFFWEEPHLAAPTDQVTEPKLLLSMPAPNLTVVAPVLPHGMNQAAVRSSLAALLEALVMTERLHDAILWYYTPAALPFSDFLATSQLVVYDVMDDLSAFAGADPALPVLERKLLDRADVVFTGGSSLYEAKRDVHTNVHPFPSGVDIEHFRPARGMISDPPDQAKLPHPRLGFYGVIDERLDIRLLAEVAKARPAWQIVMVGPIVKIDPASLPQATNIHYLGGKSYNELPAYLSGWSVAMLPFARNAATRFISPTKTPEYLAGGRPVVSTPIIDVVRHYGHVKGVGIAATAHDFVEAAEQALSLRAKPDTWLPEADELLAGCSWRDIWSRMSALIEKAQQQRDILVPVTARMARS